MAKEKFDTPAYDCKYLGVGFICLKHSQMTPFGHLTFGCEKKCKDYKKVK